MTSHKHEPTPTTARQVTDPVCGMAVDPATTDHAAVHDGEHFYFCSAGCKDKFLAAPDAYAHQPDEQDHDPAGQDTQRAHHGHNGAGGQLTAPTPGAGEAVEYTCPMHPEIRQNGPGACPICGMALEPVIVTADTGPSQELLPNGDIMIVPFADDPAIYVWDPSADWTVEFACQAAGRDLTEAEWAEHFPGQSFRSVCPQN
jgi:YHS domain-containing protein